MSAVFLGVQGGGREAARLAQCDMRLKAIALALDAYKQANGKFPVSLATLHNDKYLREANALHCPDDPRQAEEAGYEEFYVVRTSRDADDMPLVVCPFHEAHGAMGMQAFKGRYTKQYSTRPARVIAARDAIIQRPGKAPIAAAAGMELRGGDHIITGGNAPTATGGGEIIIEFADGSTAKLRSGTKATVLQSFLMGEPRAPLYTLIRQSLGEAVYKVHPGSKFDVVTPTATSGARGTEFIVTVKSNGETELQVLEGKVAFTTLAQTVLVPVGKTVSVLLNGIIKLL